MFYPDYYFGFCEFDIIIIIIIIRCLFVEEFVFQRWLKRFQLYKEDFV